MVVVYLFANGGWWVAFIEYLRDLSQHANKPVCVNCHVSESVPQYMQTSILPPTIISSFLNQTITSGAWTFPQTKCFLHNWPQSPIQIPTISTTLHPGASSEIIFLVSSLLRPGIRPQFFGVCTISPVLTCKCFACNFFYTSLNPINKSWTTLCCFIKGMK